ncbi:MAG TPA: hypothetical protein PLX89_26750 [Verrucomicrobiota bacterium]|nr:hypothetical protein [Verrucomicrobiales bacterium]HRI16607.1 hypothetical protein [Verrucomicrobiota bacterium]
MRLVLDTHSALWMFAGSPRLSMELQDDLTDPRNDLLFGDASAWEIVIKHALGKLPLPNPPATLSPRRDQPTQAGRQDRQRLLRPRP